MLLSKMLIYRRMKHGNIDGPHSESIVVLSIVRIPIESVHASHENRSLGDEQLDEGIADTLVGETQFAGLTWAETPLREQNLAHQVL